MHKKKTLRKGTKYPQHAFTYYFLFFFCFTNGKLFAWTWRGVKAFSFSLR